MDNWNRKTAIITGVTGQDGSYLAEFLLEKGYRVVGLKRRTSLISTGRIDHIYSNSRFEMHYCSMLDPGSMYRVISEEAPDEIYNLAAQSHVRVSFETPEETAQIVAMGTLRILETILNVNPDIKLYQASSSEMFGDNKVRTRDLCPHHHMLALKSSHIIWLEITEKAMAFMLLAAYYLITNLLAAAKPL